MKSVKRKGIDVIVWLLILFFLIFIFRLILIKFLLILEIVLILLLTNWFNRSRISKWFFIIGFLSQLFCLIIIFLTIFQLSSQRKLSPVLLKSLHFRKSKNNWNFILNTIILISKRNYFKSKLYFLIVIIFQIYP